MMKFAKRIGLFILVNLCVVLTISFLIQILGLKPFITRSGLDVPSLLIFCLIWGMGGAVISLFLSKMMAKMLMNIKILNNQPSTPEYQNLVALVRRLSERAGLKKVPEVGVYDANEMNAFATGPTERNSLVAVSSALLYKMNDQELEGVLAHEIAHIKNGDMVTMTLLQGIVNAFVMFLARLLAFFLASRGKNDNSRAVSGSYFIWVYLFEIVFMIAGSMVLCAFSRFREFRADKGGAELASSYKMIQALERLRSELEYRKTRHEETKEQPALAYLKISSKKTNGFMHLFATHPPLEERIERLKARR